MKEHKTMNVAHLLKENYHKNWCHEIPFTYVMFSVTTHARCNTVCNSVLELLTSNQYATCFNISVDANDITACRQKCE